MGYKLIPESMGRAREFCITLGLLEGYGEGKEHTPDDVQRLLEQWLQERCEKDLPYFSATVFPGRISYAWKNESGAVAQSEPAVEIRGMVSNIYYPELATPAIQGILSALARFIGESLKQTRIYIICCGESWAYELEGQTTPREEAKAAGHQK